MKVIQRIWPPDGVAAKYLQETADGFVVESTYIRRPEKQALCISTQVGCVVGCKFCVSGLRSEGQPYQRSLTGREMFEECRNVVREMDFAAHPGRLTFAFMGEGEPFLNFSACMEAFHALAAQEWPVPVQFAISTSGIRPDLIRRLGKMTFPVSLKLQVSLHGPNDQIRARIVPLSRPLAEILSAVRAYRKRCGRPVVWNYVPCSGLNDQPEHARALVKLLGPGWRVKLTRLNLPPGSPFFPSPQENVVLFRRILENGGLSTSFSRTDESGIDSGCGQLSYRHTRSK